MGVIKGKVKGEDGGKKSEKRGVWEKTALHSKNRPQNKPRRNISYHTSNYSSSSEYISYLSSFTTFIIVSLFSFLLLPSFPSLSFILVILSSL